MNNAKIEQLMEECGTYIDPHNLEVSKLEIEHLCETVAIECAALCEDNPAMTGRKLSDLILKHFNIEL